MTSKANSKFPERGTAARITSNRGRSGIAPAGNSGPPGHLFQPDDADIRIDRFIGRDGFGITDLAAALANISGPPAVSVRSGGGCIQTAQAIAARLRAAGASVHAYSAESAAVLTVIAGKQRTIAGNGWMAVHPAWIAIAGGRRELEVAARLCADIDNMLAEAIARWSHLTPDQAAKAIGRGRVWSAAEALESGLVDEIGPEAENIGQRPDQLIDGPERQYHGLRSAADSARFRVEQERARDEAESCTEAAPAVTEITSRHKTARMLEAFAPPARLASAFDAAAGHARHESEKQPWTPRWSCPQCGALNYHPPAAGYRATACTTCKTKPED